MRAGELVGVVLLLVVGFFGYQYFQTWQKKKQAATLDDVTNRLAHQSALRAGFLGPYSPEWYDKQAASYVGPYSPEWYAARDAEAVAEVEDANL